MRMKSTKVTRRGTLTLAAACVLWSTGVLADETRRVEGLDFDEIDVLGAVSVEVRQGERALLQLRGPEGDLEKQPFYVKGDRLVLGHNPEHPRHDFQQVKFRVEVPELEELRVKGSGDAYIKPLTLAEEGSFSVDGSGDIKLFGIMGPALELTVKGSGDIKAVDVEVEDIRAVVAGSGDLFIKQLQADSGEFVVTGSGDIKVVEGGRVGRVEANIVGSGDIDMRGVASESAEIAIVGSGTANLGSVASTIEATILGSGDVLYDGDPEIESVQLGSGAVRRRD